MKETEIPHRENTHERNPFDAIIVLGSAVVPKHNDKSAPDYRGKSRTIAAAEALREGQTEYLIFAGGKTGGEALPSEAQAMRDYIQNKYVQNTGKFSKIPDDKIFLEQQSTNTSGNFKNCREIITEKFGENAYIGVLTNDSHLPRAVMQARRAGIKVTPVSAEQLLASRDRRLGATMKNYNNTTSMKITRIKEFARRGLVLIDHDDKLSGFVTPILRGEGSLNVRALKERLKQRKKRQTKSPE